MASWILPPLRYRISPLSRLRSTQLSAEWRSSPAQVPTLLLLCLRLAYISTAPVLQTIQASPRPSLIQEATTTSRSMDLPPPQLESKPFSPVAWSLSITPARAAALLPPPLEP